MELSNNKTLIKIGNAFFVIALIMIIFSFIDLFLRKFEDVIITVNYQWIWLAIIIITLLFLGILRKWKRFFLVIFLGFTVVSLFLCFIISWPLSVTKAVKNSRYDVQANPNYYKIYDNNGFYKEVIASKKSQIFFKPNVKTGLNYNFEVKKVSETPEEIVLEIKTPQTVTDTIKKFN